MASAVTYRHIALRLQRRFSLRRRDWGMLAHWLAHLSAFLLWAAMTWFLAGAAWRWLAPAPLLAAPPAETQAANLAAQIAARTVFGRDAPASDGAAGETMLPPSAAAAAAGPVKVLGVWAFEPSGRGAALLEGADGVKAVVVGAEAAPGLRLQSVHADHVVLSRGEESNRVDAPQPDFSSLLAKPARPDYPGGD